MPGRIYVRDLEILQNLEGELSQFHYGTTKVLGAVAQGLTETKEFLNSRATYWTVELRKREDALRACLSNDDRDRNDHCSKQSMAVREAQEAIDKIKKLQVRLEQAIGEYQPHANRLQQLVSSKTGKAKADLHRSIEKYKNYLAQAASTSSYQSTGSPVNSKGKSTFSIANWDGYPNGPRPAGPFAVLEGNDYETARRTADNVNRRMHIENPELSGLQIHEIHPVKFSGSPSDPTNKIILTRAEHAKYTTWWNNMLRDIASD